MRTFTPIVLLTAATIGGSQARTADPRLLRSIELPGVQGRIDHLAYDASAQRLYVAALGNDTVEVLDVQQGVRLKTLRGFHEPQGIAVATDPHLVTVANGEGEGVDLLDTNDYHVTRTIALGDDSDNVRYDPAAKRLYVGYGNGALATIDPATGNVISRVALRGHPESFQLERSGTKIYVNVPTSGEIEVVDRAALNVVATWPVTEARSNFPMALDEAHHRLFIGCRRPAKVLVYDTRNGKGIGAADIVGDTDDLFYDARSDRLYVSGGEGFLDVLDVKDSAHPTKLAHLATAPGARTSLFAADSGQMYIAVPHRGGQRAEIRAYTMPQ